MNTVLGKVLLSRIYYEENIIDSLMSHLDSFEVYIRRKKEVTDFYRTNSLNSIRYLKKLVGLTGEKEQIKLLRNEIENEQVLTEKSWLLEKLDEL